MEADILTLGTPTPGGLIRLNHNGAIEIDQRNTSSGLAPGRGVILGIPPDGIKRDLADFYALFHNATNKVIDYTQAIDAPDNLSLYALQLDAVTGGIALASEQVRLEIIQIEGPDYRALHEGIDLSLSFWVKSAVTGNYTVNIESESGARKRLELITVLVANVWEKKEINFQSDVANLGSWSFLEGEKGLSVVIYPVIKNAASGTVGEWQTGGTPVVTSQVEWGIVNAQKFSIAQVQLQKGTESTNFGNRFRDTELEHCKRFFQKSVNYIQPVHFASQQGAITQTIEKPKGGAEHFINVVWPVAFAKSPIDFRLYSNFTGFQPVYSPLVTHRSNTLVFIADLVPFGFFPSQKSGVFKVTTTTMADYDLLQFQWSADASMK